MTFDLTEDELRRFANEGFLVRQDQVPERVCDELLLALSEHIQKTANLYLEDFSERPFFELLASSTESAEVFFDSSQGLLQELPPTEWESRAMRIGHGLHKTLPPFKSFAERPELLVPLQTLTQLALRMSAGTSAEEAVFALGNAAGPGLFAARFVQSAIVYKQPKNEIVQFGFHRDSAYLPNDPESLVLAFVALDETTAENGCLEVIPQSHLDPSQMVFTLTPHGFVPDGREPKPAIEKAIFLPVSRGSVVFLHGQTLHASKPNRSSGPRRALIVHAMSSESTLSPRSWVNRA